MALLDGCRGIGPLCVIRDFKSLRTIFSSVDIIVTMNACNGDEYRRYASVGSICHFLPGDRDRQTDTAEMPSLTFASQWTPSPPRYLVAWNGLRRCTPLAMPYEGNHLLSTLSVSTADETECGLVCRGGVHELRSSPWLSVTFAPSERRLMTWQ